MTPGAGNIGVGSFVAGGTDASSLSQSDQIDYDSLAFSVNDRYDLYWRRFNANSYDRHYGSQYCDPATFNFTRKFAIDLAFFFAGELAL